MSSLKDKMRNYEVNPPAIIWDKIAAALDGSCQENQFPSRLREMETTPPAGVWDKIAEKLDNNEDLKFPERLHQMEVNPPTSVWSKIASELDQAEKPAAIVISQPSGFKQILRYAVAAVLVGAIAFAALRWNGFSDKAVSGAQLATANTDSGSNNAASPIESGEVTNSENFAASTLQTGQTEKQIPGIDKPYKSTSSKRTTLVQNAAYRNNHEKASSALYTYNDHVPPVADRYIMLMTPDGNLIRMSKKWGNLVCCVSGEDPEADCKDQLKKWQEKMATSALTNSTGNVMDILNLVSSLDEGVEL